MFLKQIENSQVVTTLKFGTDYETRGLVAEPVSLTFHSILRKLYTEPSIGASYQISVHLATLFQRRRFFLNQPISNKNCLWWSCLLTDLTEQFSIL
jgi:hypothetical protein